jgi:hypothetical protein
MSNGRDSINKPVLVAVFGAVGGLVAWILANAAGTATQLGIRNTPFSILASMLVGAVAAWFAVYYLLPTDMGQFKKVLALALACGVFWQPIIQGMKRTVDGISTTRTADALDDQQKKLQSASSSTDTGALLQKSADLVVDSSMKASNTDDADQKKKLEEKAQAVVASIPEAAKADPAASYNALEKVGVAAATNDQRSLASESLNSLQKSAPANCANVNDAGCVKYRTAVLNIKNAAEKRGWRDVALKADQIQPPTAVNAR